MSDATLSDDVSDGLPGVSRRRALGAIGAASFVGLAGCAARGTAGGTEGGHTADVNPIAIQPFITDAEGNAPPFNYNTLLFDPGPESIPLNDIVGADDEFGNSLAKQLSDSRRLVTRPPEGYDPEEGYDESWKPLLWGEWSEVTGSASLGEAEDGGTPVTVEVEDGIPRGRYTVWVVKFAELSNPGEFEGFVTPSGNGLVGFHNLGPKFDDRSRTENIFRLDGSGNGSIERVNEGGSMSGVPGFRPADFPFVGSAEDYEQSQEELMRIDDDLRQEDEIHFVGAYHYDDRTWGVYPGPWHVNHFDARFQF